MTLHPNQGRVVKHGYWLLRRPQKWNLIHVEVYRQVHFPVCAFDIAGQEFCLEVDQLRVQWNFPG